MLSDREEVTKFRPTRRSQNYLMFNELNNQNTTESISFSNPKQTIRVSTTDNEKVKNVDAVKVKKVARLRKGENIPIEPHHDPDSDKDMSAVENQSTPWRSTVTVSSVKKLQRTSEIIKKNESIKSQTLQQEEPESAFISSTKIHVIKVPRDKRSVSENTRTTNVSELSDCRPRNQSNISNVNHNSINDMASQIPSTHTTRNIHVRLSDLQNKQVHHKSNLIPKNDNNIRKRASSFGGTTVSRVKTTINNTKSFVDYAKNGVVSIHSKKATSNRVSVISVKKEQV
jgi:hypothetical protein